MRSAESLRPLVLLLLLAGLFVAAPARAQTADAEYQANWQEAQSALAAFANAPLAQRRERLDLAALAADCRREHARYAEALRRLGARLPPPETALAHWKLLPLHERALSAMTLALGAMDSGDEAGLAAAWSALHGSVEALQRTLREDE